MSTERIELALAVLIDAEGQVALQRRRADSKVYAGRLSLFGGHMNAGEQPLVAANRELDEELSVTFEQTRLKPLLEDEFDAVAEYADPIKVHIFQGYFPETYTIGECDGAVERYSLQDALWRSDLVPTARAGLEQYIANKRGE
ncbi:MAG TPA: NUDIX domain-containing protein [Candidatus Saccharimonadales bacterium]|nr:NUDIX domain-containing protein [Candidatus Saccharimonadales bacterium]